MTNEELIKEVEELKELLIENGIIEKSKPIIPSHTFSGMTDHKLEKCVTITKEFDKSKFNQWFNFNYDISTKEMKFLNDLIIKYGDFLEGYKEETLKAHFVIPILNKVDFLLREYGCSGLYEEIITYKTDKFIFTGQTDFTVSKGLEKGDKPYFFIQEFKRNEENSFPRPQLLAELISAIELNNWQTIKGAYIKGATWNFVILEKLGKDKYQYFISHNFDSTKIEDLRDIFRNLLFVKNEIVEMVKKEI